MDNELMRNSPNSKVHGATMGPIWGRQDPGGPHVGPMNFAVWDVFLFIYAYSGSDAAYGLLTLLVCGTRMAIDQE